jgi:hypothetical protein
MSNIQYLQRKDIDEEAWNRCIDTAENGLIYAYTYYLDAMCTAWDALVLNNYEAVMPLPWRKKWGIKYVYPPAFTQQLGIFGNRITKTLHLKSLDLVREKFAFGEYFFNYHNQPLGLQKTNFVLNLNQNYSSIRQNYKSDLLKNLKRSNRHKLRYQSSSNYQNAVTLFQLEYSSRISHVSANDYKNLNIILKELQKRDQLIIREVLDEKKEILAISVCPKDNKRIYFLLSVTVNNGRSKQANHFLLDQLIKEFSGNPLLLDFEGSDIAGIAHFYKNFGAEQQKYFFYRWNQLPWPIKLLKEKSLDAQ